MRLFSCFQRHSTKKVFDGSRIVCQFMGLEFWKRDNNIGFKNRFCYVQARKLFCIRHIDLDKTRSLKINNFCTTFLCSILDAGHLQCLSSRTRIGNARSIPYNRNCTDIRYEFAHCSDYCRMCSDSIFRRTGGKNVSFEKNTVAWFDAFIKSADKIQRFNDRILCL